MNGYASFNQVFFTDAEIAPEFMLEQEGDGWQVATTTLMHERRGADGLRRYAKPSDRPERIFQEEAKEIAVALEPYKWYPQRAGRVDLVIQRAKDTGRNTDPAVRQEIAKLMIMETGGRMDGKAGSGRAGTGPAAGAGGLARQTRVELYRPRRQPRAYIDCRGRCHAHR